MVKFNNSGKLDGIIKINKISTFSFNTASSSPSVVNLSVFDNERIIPGSSDSGWMLGIPIPIDCFINVKHIFVDYELLNYSGVVSFQRPVKFTVYCSFDEVSPKVIDSNCNIVPFGYRKM